eukprot:gene3804-21202_t
MRVCLVVLGLVAQTIVADQSRIVPSNGNLLVSLPEGAGFHIVQTEGEGAVPNEATEVVTKRVLDAKMAELKARTMERMAGLEARMTAQLVDAGAAAEQDRAVIQDTQNTMDADAATQIEESIDAYQFGNVVHPGDNLAAVLASLDGKGGGKVFLTAGVHQISSTLIVGAAAGGIAIIGEGPATIVKSTGSGAVIKLQGKGVGKPLTQVTLRSFAIDCGANQEVTTPGVWLQHVEASFVEHLQFNNCQVDIQVASSSKNWIQDNAFSADPAGAGVGGIAEDKSASKNVYRRNVNV